MRIDSKPPPIVPMPERREIKGVSAVHAVKPIAIDAYQVQNAALHGQHEPPVRENPQLPEHRNDGEDRRKMCRRVKKQAVLMELRTGVDRRRRNLRDTDTREHIDEQV